MAQDNDGFKERVTKAVLEAVIEAGRPHPGALSSHLDVEAALEGMCRAMAIFASTGAQTLDDRQKAAEALGDMEERVVSYLRFFTEQVRNGSLPPEDRGGPALRVVK